jgi:hypothetical protein
MLGVGCVMHLSVASSFYLELRQFFIFSSIVQGSAGYCASGNITGLTAGEPEDRDSLARS